MKLKAEWRAGSVTMVMGRPSYFITVLPPLCVQSCYSPNFHEAWLHQTFPSKLGLAEGEKPSTLRRSWAQCFQECGLSLQKTEEDGCVLNIDWAQFMILSVSRFGSASLAQSQVLMSVIIQAVAAHCPPGWAFFSGQAEADPAYCPTFPQKCNLSSCK